MNELSDVEAMFISCLEFQQLIADSAKGLFDTIIVHKLDRFSRNKCDSANYKRILKANGVKLLSITENLDDSPESVILESLLEGMAEYYSKNLAREVMKGMKETALQCKHTGGLPPFGYKVDPNTRQYLINEDERGMVETIFSMFLEGKGYNQIVTALAEKGYKSRYGRAIGKNVLHGILRNEKYTGVYIFNLASSKDAFGKRNGHRTKTLKMPFALWTGCRRSFPKRIFNSFRKKWMPPNISRVGIRQKSFIC